MTRAALCAVGLRWGLTLAHVVVLGSGRVFWVGPISILTIRLFPTLSPIVYYLPWAPPNAAYTLTELAE